MAYTYKSAETVIVLDNTLQQCSINASTEELMMRIYTAPWMNRVWTYQEGTLARNLLFRLSDGHCPLAFPSNEFDAPASPIHIPIRLMHDIYMYIAAQVQNLNGAIKPINIGHVALELRWRSTLHRDPHGKNDEPIAVGVLLGLDMDRLLDAEGGDRMREFLLMVSTLPRNIIFAEGEHLQISGFRWAPNTFLVPDPRRLDTDLEQNGVLCNEDGLLGEYVVFKCGSSQVTHYQPGKRITLIDRIANPVRWFDMWEHTGKTFDFDHIVIYPKTIPQSTHGTMFIAAALLSKLSEQPQLPGLCIDLFCRFQAVVHLAVVRPFRFSSSSWQISIGYAGGEWKFPIDQGTYALDQVNLRDRRAGATNTDLEHL